MLYNLVVILDGLTMAFSKGNIKEHVPCPGMKSEYNY